VSCGVVEGECRELAIAAIDCAGSGGGGGELWVFFDTHQALHLEEVSAMAAVVHRLHPAERQ